MSKVDSPFTLAVSGALEIQIALFGLSAMKVMPVARFNNAQPVTTLIHCITSKA